MHIYLARLLPVLGQVETRKISENGQAQIFETRAKSMRVSKIAAQNRAPKFRRCKTGDFVTSGSLSKRAKVELIGGGYAPNANRHMEVEDSTGKCQWPNPIDQGREPIFLAATRSRPLMPFSA